MSPSMQAITYWEGYATALMQVVENQTPTDYAPEVRKVLLRQNYESMLKQHGLSLQWIEFFLGEEV
jgi:hypothetical protein